MGGLATVGCMLLFADQDARTLRGEDEDSEAAAGRAQVPAGGGGAHAHYARASVQATGGAAGSCGLVFSLRESGPKGDA